MDTGTIEVTASCSARLLQFFPGKIRVEVAEAGEGHLYLVDDPKHLPKVIAEDAMTHTALN